MRKNVLLPTLPVATTQSLATSFTSPITTITYQDNVAYQINITTSNSTGTFAVQASLDYIAPGPQGSGGRAGNWITLPLSGANPPTVAAANDNILINLNNLPFNAVRLVYTSTIAGTGTADIFIMTKAMGA